MSSVYTLVASPVFKLSRQRFAAFLAEKYSEPLAEDTLESIKQRIKQQLSIQPKIAPVSERLLALGITDYRQWHLDKHNIVFYRVDDEKLRVELLLLMDSRQSIQKLLFELNLLI